MAEAGKVDKNVDAFWQFAGVKGDGMVFENPCTGDSVWLAVEQLFSVDILRVADGKHKIAWGYQGPAPLPPGVWASIQSRLEVYFEGLGARITERG